MPIPLSRRKTTLIQCINKTHAETAGELRGLSRCNVTNLRHKRREFGTVCYWRSSRIISLAFSAIIIVGELVFPEVMVGMTEASTTRNPVRP